MIAGRVDLDHVDRDQVRMTAESRQEIEHPIARRAAGGRKGDARRLLGIDHVDVEGDRERPAVRRCDGDRLPREVVEIAFEQRVALDVPPSCRRAN